MKYTPTKRCDRLDKHQEHEWLENRVFRRQCPGRTTTKLASRNVRRRAAKNGTTKD